MCGSAPLLDDDIYSVVREVAPVVATATERMLDSEYSVINASSDWEEVGQEGCGQVVPPVVGHAFPVAKEPVRPQLPVPPPPLPHVEESSPSYSTVGGLPGVKAGTFNPPRGEQPGYFVVGPDTVRASLVLNGHVPREGDDDDTYSHLAEPPRAHAGADQEGGGEGEDVDTYSHLAEPPRAHAVVTKADEEGGGGDGDGDTYSHLVDVSPRGGTVGAVAGGTRQGGNVREDEDTYSRVADPPCSARHVVPPPQPQPPPSSNGSNDLAACFSFSDGGPSSSLPSGNGDGGVVPPCPPNMAGVRGAKAPDEVQGGDGGWSSNNSSPKTPTTEHSVAKGTPSPGGKKRSMTVIPRRPAPPVPVLNRLDKVTTPTPPSHPSSDSPQKKEVTKATTVDRDLKDCPDVKEPKKPKKKDGLGKFFKFGRSSGSSPSSDQPPVEQEPSPTSLKTSTLPSMGRHGVTIRPGAHPVAGKIPVEVCFMGVYVSVCVHVCASVCVCVCVCECFGQMC